MPALNAYGSPCVRTIQASGVISSRFALWASGICAHGTRREQGLRRDAGALPMSTEARAEGWRARAEHGSQEYDRFREDDVHRFGDIRPDRMALSQGSAAAR